MLYSTIAEAKSLQSLAKNQGIEVPASTDSLISSAEKRSEERQIEEAFIFADEAILQLQLSMQKKEQAELVAENNNAQQSLNATSESLAISRSMLVESKHFEGKHSPKEKATK
jgi:hypothetical protein